MRRFQLLALTLVALLSTPPTIAQASTTNAGAVDTAINAPAATAINTRAINTPADAVAVLRSVRTVGVAWGVEPATGRMTITADDTVSARDLAALRAAAARAGAVLRREPGRLRVLIAGGQAIYSSGWARCSLGANVRSGSTYYFVTSGHCTAAASTWYADSAHTTVLGPVVGTSFPGNDYGVVRYTSGVAHPSAVYTYPGLQTIYRAGNAYVGESVCRSGSTTGVRCGVVTGLNATVNYVEGSVSGLIRTNICAESGDSGGPLYDPSTGTILGLLSGGTGDCTTGGTSYYQPITEVLAVYGLTIP